VQLWSIRPRPPGTSHGINAGLRHFGNAFGFQVIGWSARWAPNRWHSSHTACLFGVPVNGEKVAADSIRHGFGDAQDGMAAMPHRWRTRLLQNSCARLRRLDVASATMPIA